MKFIDFFAGVGGFRRGLELSGHQCVGFCEWDRFTTASYISMHLIIKEQRNRLSELSLQNRQKEILKDEYRNGEWYSNDIRAVDAGSLPKSECWTFGAPCQDFSIAGKRAGLDGDRSSLIREIFRLLEEQKEQDRPEWLIYENVKGMLSSNRGLDYLSILSEMDRLGYDIEWQNINSKWWIPQNRERIYTIGHLRRCGSAKILPVTGTDGKNCLLQMIPGKQGQRVYDADGISSTLSSQGGGQGAKTGLYAVKIIGTTCETRSDSSNVHDTDSVSTTLLASDYKDPKLIALHVITPERENKRQNGRRFKEDGEPMFTLTAQDRHGVALDIKSFYSKTRGKPEREGYAPTLDHDCNIGVIQKTNIDNKKESGIYVEMPDGFVSYCVWYEKYNCYIAIRKLTPKECFRLQGWADDYFEKAAFVNSDSQLYKQAGNGVSVPVVKAIGDKIAEFERKKLEIE